MVKGRAAVERGLRELSPLKHSESCGGSVPFKEDTIGLILKLTV